MMSTAGSEHGWISMRIAARLSTYVEERQLGCVFNADTGFIIHRNPDSVRAPDVAFVRQQRIPAQLPKGFFDGPPDLAVEVISPNDSTAEVQEKTEDWLNAGCSEVWLINPKTKTATRCTLVDNLVEQTNVDRLSSPILSGFDLIVARLWQQ